MCQARRLSIIAVLVACFFTVGAPIAAEKADRSVADARHPQPTVVITGANRGLGLEFSRQFAAAGATVIATARRPEDADDLRKLGVRVEQLDVADSASVKQFRERIGDLPVDILINNAGIGSWLYRLEEVDADALERYFQVNTLGPLRVTQALLPSLRRGAGKTVVNITSDLASLARNTRGGAYGYRESKAALNMFTRTLAAELRPEEFICVVISPGWVRTDMGGPQAAQSPSESIAGIIRVLRGLTPKDSGKFLDYRGEELPW
jgi:NAD(P)-dependent dehydrogenase (short-subunit alcohol dehydrogenase family)